MTKALLIGHRGNMGRRYGAILNYLGVPFHGIDLEDKPYSEGCVGATHVIIATPTDMHLNHIKVYSYLDLPVLCEKPISKNYAILKSAIDDFKLRGTSLTSVNQYAYLVDPNAEGDSYYSYYNSGKDGLAYDCVSILGLANGPVVLSKISPFYRCAINGCEINIRDMDSAYIAMIESWLKDPQENYDFILSSHKKAHEYEIR